MKKISRKAAKRIMAIGTRWQLKSHDGQVIGQRTVHAHKSWGIRFVKDDGRWSEFRFEKGDQCQIHHDAQNNGFLQIVGADGGRLTYEPAD